MRSALPVVLVVSCGACGPIAPGSEPDSIAAPTAYLVWTGGADDGHTRWLDAVGHEQGRADGVWIAAGHTLWRLAQTTDVTAAPGCDRDGRSATPRS